MPRKKIIGKCKVEGCERELDSLGLCGLHYRRQYYKGRLHKIQDGKRSHRQYYNWASRKDKLCAEWREDFWKFVKDVGEAPPSEMHYLRKRILAEPFGPDNFHWVEYLRKQPEETVKEWTARKWKHRVTKNPNINRNGRVFRKLGVSFKEYDRIITERAKEQSDLCAICRKPDSRMTKNNIPSRLAVDHCHATNKIRGLLCWRCNRALGSMEDSIPLLESMIAYLRKYS